MKKLYLLFALPLLLSGCSPYQNNDPYQIDRQHFYYECNPDTVMFKSNYRVEMYDNDRLFLESDFDYGKVLSNKDYYYHLVDKGDSVEFTSYLSDGTPNTSIVSKEYMYNYWFGFGQYLFQMKYEDYRYVKESNFYECTNVELSGLTITRGIFIVYKNKPQYAEFNFAGRGKYVVEFSKHGEISITLPTRPTYTHTVTIDYQLSDELTLQEAVANRIGGLDIEYVVEDLGNHQCKISFTYYDYHTVALVEALLTTKGDPRISNAHDTFIKLDKSVYIDGDSLVIPFDLTNTENRYLLEETIDDLKNNRTEYGEAYYDDEGDESSTSYNYCVYLWYDYDPNNSFSELTYGAYNYLLAKIHITSTSIEYYEKGFSVSFYIDYNHDGVLTSNEIELLHHHLKIVKHLLNFEPDGCSFDYPSY